LNIEWIPLPFGEQGMLGGLTRVKKLWQNIDRHQVIHARGNVAAIAAVLKSPKYWIWDARALHSDQRRAINGKAGLEFFVMRIVEWLLAKRSNAIIVITHAVVPIFEKRYKVKRTKISVIPTCVDLEKFSFAERSKATHIRVLLQGTFSAAYDFDLMNGIIKRLKEVMPTHVSVFTSHGSTNLWNKIEYDSHFSALHDEMPKVIAEHDFGMSIWREDLGSCLASVASTKVAEFLAVGRPVIVNMSQGDMKEIIESNNVGIITKGNSESEINKYVIDLQRLFSDKNLAKRCRQVASNRFNLETGVRELIYLYSKVSRDETSSSK
jgi:glycosyltransferase involved in cell wall biosynthesis